ncbi:MAG: transposase [Oligoflexia bacterium]|nr:transposase [Oligoflexia bacterium]
MKRMRTSILRRYRGEINPDDFCFAIDDTDNKKYGKKLYNVGNWRSSKGIYFGQRVVVLALVNIKDEFAIPLDYRFAIKKGEPDYKSGLALAVNMMEEIAKANFPKLPLVVDSWFDSADLMRSIVKLGFPFIFEIKSSRKVHAAKHSPWMNIKSIFNFLRRESVFAKLNPIKKQDKNKKKWISQLSLYVKKYEDLINTIAVYNRKNSLQPFAFYATTDLTMSGAKLWGYSRARWAIECLFRDNKQNLSWGKLGCSGREGADLSVCIPFVVYTFLTINFKGKWKKGHRDSIGLTVKKIRNDSFEKTINSLVKGKGIEKNKIKLLKARRLRDKLNKKPTNKAAERNSPSKKQAA